MILIGALTLLAACGGGGDDDRVLHLRTGDYTEAELRAELRAQGFTEGDCNQLAGLSAEEVQEIMEIAWRDGEDDPDKPVVQTPDPDDDLRQAEIVLEECDRLY